MISECMTWAGKDDTTSSPAQPSFLFGISDNKRIRILVITDSAVLYALRKSKRSNRHMVNEDRRFETWSLGFAHNSQSVDARYVEGMLNVSDEAWFREGWQTW